MRGSGTSIVLVHKRNQTTLKSGEREMEQTLIKTMELSNVLKLDFYDISRKLAGDRWYVGMIARIDIPLTDSLLTNQQFSNYSVEEIRNALGEAVRFQQKRERHYIDEREKDALLHGLMDSFIKSTLNYFSHPDFPTSMFSKNFKHTLNNRLGTKMTAVDKHCSSVPVGEGRLLEKNDKQVSA